MPERENSVRDIAKRVGLPPATVHRFLRGENVSLETAVKMLPVRDVCPCCGRSTVNDKESKSDG